MSIKHSQKPVQHTDNVYNTILITRPVSININNIGKGLKNTLERVLSSQFEGKCIVEGYIKKKSIKILTYSSGIVKSDHVKFDVAFECDVCMPVEGMNITCNVKNITKAGIRAELGDVDSPIVIFIARDHHDITENFNSVSVNDTIRISVIGQRYELNDSFISIIAELLPPQKNLKIVKKKRLINKHT